jgi:hypothetical protein
VTRRLIWLCVFGLLVPGPVRAEELPAEAALRLWKEQQALGKLLVAVLDDPKKPNLDRVRAAEGLGLLRYDPAVATLVRHIDLHDSRPTTSDDEWDVIGPYPCVKALRRLGLETLEPLFEEYIREKDDKRRELLEMALPDSIKSSKYREVAVRYVRGYAHDVTNQDQMDRVYAFYQLLHPDPKKMVIPPEWLKRK